MSSTNNPNNTPIIILIRDGWGQNPNPEHDAFNAIKLADTPVADRLMVIPLNTPRISSPPGDTPPSA